MKNAAIIGSIPLELCRHYT